MLKLANRRLIRLAGPDAPKFLQGLVTADVTQVRAGQARPALFLSSTGQILSEALVFSHRESFFLDALSVNCPKILKIVAKRRLAAKVAVSPVEAEVFASAAPKAAGPAQGLLEVADPRGAHFGLRYYDIGGDVAAAADRGDGASAHTAPLSPHDALLLLNGYLLDHMYLHPPGDRTAGNAGQTVETLKLSPFDLNLDRMGYITTNKGCYVGQEIVNQILNKMLVNKYTLNLAVNREALAGLPAAGDRSPWRDTQLASCLRKALGTEGPDLGALCDLKLVPVEAVKAAYGERRGNGPEPKLRARKPVPVALFGAGFGFVLLHRTDRVGQLLINGEPYTLQPVA